MAARRRRSPARSKLAREFVSEVDDLLERMRADLADLGDQRARGELVPDLVNRLFRSAHTLKGVAGMFGFEGVGTLSHRLEDILDDLRMGRLDPGAPALDLLDEAVAVLAVEVELVGRDVATTEGSEDLRSLMQRIETALHRDGTVPAAPDSPALDESLLRALTEYEEHRLRECLRAGRSLYVVEAAFDLLAFEEGLAELSESSRALGEIISTLPAPGDTPESQIRFSLIVASELDAESFERRLDVPAARVRGVCSEAPAEAITSPSNGTEEASAEPGTEGAIVTTTRVEQGGGDGGPAGPCSDPGPAENAEVSDELPLRQSDDLESLKSISETVRVDIRKLDELMNLVGELVIQRGAIGRSPNSCLQSRVSRGWRASLRKPTRRSSASCRSCRRVFSRSAWFR